MVAVSTTRMDWILQINKMSGSFGLSSSLLDGWMDDGCTYVRQAISPSVCPSVGICLPGHKVQVANIDEDVDKDEGVCEFMLYSLIVWIWMDGRMVGWLAGYIGIWSPFMQISCHANNALIHSFRSKRCLHGYSCFT